MLERGALSDAKVIELSSKFVCVKITPRDNADVARMMGVSKLPDLRLVSAKGDQLKAWQGGVSAVDLAKGMEEALAGK